MGGELPKFAVEVAAELGGAAVAAIPGDAGDGGPIARSQSLLHGLLEPLPADELDGCAAELLTKQGLQVPGGIVALFLQICEGD